MTALPLLLLDVDGVVNDLRSVFGFRRSWPERRYPFGAVELAIPLHVSPLLAHLGTVCEIWWCSTWQELANRLLPELAEVGPYPVVGIGEDVSDPDWKVRAAAPLAAAALDAGRRVYWVEDFDGELPEGMPPGVTFVDTAPDYVLLPRHLPPELLSGPTRRLPGG